MKKIISKAHVKTVNVISWDYINYNTKGIILVFNKDFLPKGYIVFTSNGFEYRTKMCGIVKPKYTSIKSAKEVADKLPNDYNFCFINF